MKRIEKYLNHLRRIIIKSKILVFILFVQTIFSQELLEQGQSFLASKQYTKAIKVFEEILENDHVNIIAMNELAGVYNKLGNIPLIIHFYNKSLNIKENQPDTWLSLGNIYYHDENIPSAVYAYKNSIKHIPNFSKGHNNLATLFKESG